MINTWSIKDYTEKVFLEDSLKIIEIECPGIPRENIKASMIDDILYLKGEFESRTINYSLKLNNKEVSSLKLVNGVMYINITDKKEEETELTIV